jgi:hypothetical protein
MADAHDLHQIEYRHHQTRDLSPVASSMPSSESLRGWDSWIRTWVRHPHADRLSESVCYQVRSTGKAALAWRYWDQRAAERADGTRGRPLVSRVLVGHESVLTPAVAVALCRSGLPDSAGPMPGGVPDDAKLPTISADELNAMTREKAQELDQRAVQQDGLQAVVAAALADPATPLAISIRDVVIQRPLREGVQYPLLWGLLRIAGPLLGSVGRGWSFSTFELPLGEMDPATLPGIVFRQAQDGGQAPPARWRKEVKVRPLATDALNPGLPYSDQVQLAGWLVTRYQERGGKALRQFIIECCGNERSLQARLDRVYDQLRDIESPVTVSPGSAQFVSLAARPAPARQEPEPAGPDLEEAERAEPERAEAVSEPGHDVAAADEDSPAAADEPLQPEARETDDQARDADRAAADDAQDQDQDQEQEQEDVAAADEDSPAAADEPLQPEIPETDDQASETDDQAPETDDQARDADGEYWETDSAAGGAQQVGAQQRAEPTAPQETTYRPATTRGETVISGHGGYQEHWRGGPQPSDWMDERERSLAPPKERQMAPPLQVPDRGGQQADARNMAHQARRQPITVSYLLKQLELAGSDSGRFNAALQGIFHIGFQSDDPDDRPKSWAVISNNDWLININKYREFRLEDLAKIFYIVVIPELPNPVSVETIVRWAYHAPRPMIGGLLFAARRADLDTWQTVMQILEPVLAVRWTVDSSIQDLWDNSRPIRAVTEPGSGDNKRGVFGRFRRH